MEAARKIEQEDQDGNLAYELFNRPVDLPPPLTLYNEAETQKGGEDKMVLDVMTSNPEAEPVPPNPGYMTNFKMDLPIWDRGVLPTVSGTLVVDRLPVAVPSDQVKQPGQTAIPVNVNSIRYERNTPILLNETEPFTVPNGFPPRAPGTLLYTTPSVQIDWSTTSTMTTYPTANFFDPYIGEPMTQATVNAMSSALRYHLSASGATIHNVVYDAGTGALNLVYTADGIGSLGTSVVYPGGYSTTFTEEQKKKIIAEVARETMRSNLVIRMGDSSRKTLDLKVSPQEQKARDTLRDMLTEAEWRRYVTNGFIMVKGASGRWYQIFNVYHERIRVYENGKHIHNICIHTDTECPPTDHVINMKVLIEIDEQEVISGGNVHNTPNLLVKPKRTVSVPESVSVLEVARQVKENPRAFANRGLMLDSFGSYTTYTVGNTQISLGA